MKIVIDIDGTICEEMPTFEKCLAKPIKGAVEKINLLHDEGNFIYLYTARGWGEFKMTEAWLKTNNIKYDVLLCGKPVYDIWIDDRAIKFESWSNITCEKK
jgi:uncharacterized HAD superfamily protein